MSNAGKHGIPGGVTRPRTLIVLHSHLRPGGVRRVVELLLPHVVQAGGFSRTIVATGESSPDGWESEIAQRAGAVCVVERAFGYFSEQDAPPAVLRRAIRSALAHLCNGGDVTIWFQNPGLCRNPLLNEEVRRAAQLPGVRVLAHHHDFWFDNRWPRLAEMRAAGFTSVPDWGRATFCAGGAVSHVVINAKDRRVAAAAGWHVRKVPNPIMTDCLGHAEVRRARRWIREHVGGACWICPGRMLRRKNVLEAVLLTRLCHPGAKLLLASEASSADEAAYALAVRNAASAGGWPVVFVDFSQRGVPRMDTLTAAADAILLTSLMEGFGLAYLEAASLKRPLLARRLPVVADDLRRCGFRGGSLYTDVAVPAGLFSFSKEKERQRRLGGLSAALVPKRWQAFLTRPNVREGMPFRCLSLEAQLEVLSHPEAVPALDAANPWMRRIREAGPRPASWVDGGSKLSASETARRLVRAMGAGPTAPVDLDRIVRATLSASPFYPLLAPTGVSK